MVKVPPKEYQYIMKVCIYSFIETNDNHQSIKLPMCSFIESAKNQCVYNVYYMDIIYAKLHIII